MHNTYFALIIIASVILAFITSARIAAVLFHRWSLFGSDRTFFVLACGAAGALAMFYGIRALLDFGGLFAGLLGVVATVPFVGFVWVYLVAVNKVMERILHGLSERIN